MSLIWWTAAAATAVVALLFTYFTIRRAWTTRASRSKCAACTYDLSGSPAANESLCPECGLDAHQARRSRRKFLARNLVRVFLLVSLAWQLAEQPRRAYELWTSFIPTTLIVLAPGWWTRAENETAYRAIDQRENDMFAWQWSVAVRLEEHISDENLRASVLLPAQCREGVPIVVKCWPGSPEMQSSLCDRAVVITTRAAGGRAAESVLQQGAFVCGWGDKFPQQEFLVLPAMPAGVHSIAFDVEVTTDQLSRKALLVRRTIEVPIAIAPASSKPALTPSFSESFDTAIRQSISVRLGSGYLGTRPIEFCFSGKSTGHVATGVKVELLRDGERVGAADVLDAFGYRSVECAVEQAHYRELCVLIAGVEPDLPETRPFERWKVRIIGDLALSLATSDATEYWAGSIEVPLTDLLKHR